MYHWELFNVQTSVYLLTHLGLMMHAYVRKMCQHWFRWTISWANVDKLSIGPKGTNFSEIWSKKHNSSSKKMHSKISAEWRPFCSGLNVSTLKLCATYPITAWKVCWKCVKFDWYSEEIFALSFIICHWKSNKKEQLLYVHFLLTKIAGYSCFSIYSQVPL